MKKLTLLSAMLLLSNVALAGKPVYVKPHVTKNGTYVSGSYRSSPNGTKLDNYSTVGNVNPYTGKPGTINPYKPVSPKKPK